MTALRPASSPVLPARDAYRLWAPCYDAENAVSFLEDAAVREVTPDRRGRAFLDAGCGTGRRLREVAEPAMRVGVDLVIDMLARARDPAAPATAGTSLAAADVRALPFRDGTFDLIWCRLVLGHIREIPDAYAGLARVARPGASLVVTDFHAAAAEAGHTRSFRDATGEVRTVEHYVHPLTSHRAAAESAGWRLTLQRDLAIGPTVRPFYERAGALQRYGADSGLPLVLLLRFER